MSDGPYRSYTVDSHTIEFKHRTNREITGFSEITILVIEALKTLGKERISDYHVKKIRQLLTKEEKETLLQESKTVSAWILELIHKITGKDDN